MLTTLQAFGEGIFALFDPQVLLYIFIGVVVGVIIGVLPTISGMMTIALIIPFILKAPPAAAIGLLVAFSGVTETGGLISAILINIPGTGTNSATLLDGFPMNQKGEGARAIGAGLTASMFGGMFGPILAIVVIGFIVPIVMAFYPGDLVLLIVLGLSILGVITRGSPLKGMISGLLGLIIALISVFGATGTERFTFNTTFLYEGFSIVTVAVGLFGIGTLLNTFMEGRDTMATGVPRTRITDTFEGFRDVLRHKWLWLRSTLIGYIVGVIPGAGGQVATWTAYGQAKQTSKHPELFGTGCVEGVIAPESANNAKEAGALMTTMAFGIPGSSIMAIMIAALYAVGVVPGPAMVREHLPLVFTLLGGLALANFLGAALCFASSPYLIRVAYTPIVYLFPVIISLVFIGTYVVKLSMINVAAAIGFGLLGLIMARLGYSRPAFILGFVLGDYFEYNFWVALKSQGPLFWVTPISLSLILLIIIIFTGPYLKSTFKRMFRKEAVKL